MTTEGTSMAAAYAAAKDSKKNGGGKKVAVVTATSPLVVNLGAAFDPDAFMASMAEAEKASAKMADDLAAMSARAGDFDGFMGKIPMAVWMTCVRQAPQRLKLRETSRDGAEALRVQIGEIERKLDAELNKIFSGEVGNLLPAEKEQVGPVAKAAWLVYQLATASASPTKGYVGWLMGHSVELGILAKLGRDGEPSKGASLVRWGHERYAFSAHAAERVVLSSLRQYAAGSPENAGKLGVPADPKRIVPALIETINGMEAARAADIDTRLTAIRDGVDREKTVQHLEAKEPGDYLLQRPEEVRGSFTFHQVLVRIHSDGETISFVNAFGRGARTVEKFKEAGITLPLASIFAEKAPAGAKGPTFGAWATLRAAVVAEKEKLTKREEGEALRVAEVALCEKEAGKMEKPIISDSDFVDGKTGVVLVGFRGLFKYKVKVPGKEGGRPTDRDARMWNPMCLVERSLDKDEHSRITLRFTPERTARMFEGARDVPYTEMGDNDRPFSGVGHSVLQSFLRASTARSRKDQPTPEAAEADADVGADESDNK